MSEIPGKKSATADPPLQLEAVGLLAAGLAHDLNTLLSGIMTTADLMAAQVPSDSPIAEDLGLLAAQAERAGDLIRQLLAFSRQAILSPGRLDLARLVARAAPLLRGLVGRHIGLSLPSRPGLEVVADAGALERVLVNLVTNARDSIGSRPGHIAIRLGDMPAEAIPAEARRFMPPAHYATLSVSDDGPGVSEELRARIFEPFFTTRAQGTGLGLSTAYGLVKQSGGFLLLAPSGPRGACFTVALPLAGAQAKGADLPGQRARPTILLAEDEALLRGCASRGLEGAGFHVIAAASGEEALEAFAAHPEVRALVCDIRMPGLDGVDVTRRVRAERPGFPVLLMSGFADGPEREALAALDVAFLPKPFRLGQLQASVAALI